MATTTNDTVSQSGLSDAASEASAAANVTPATAFSTSGAPVQIVPDVDPSHPAVDNNPRSGTTIAQNRIDFNDPTIPGADAVAKALGMKTEAQAEADAATVEAMAKAKTAAADKPAS